MIRIRLFLLKQSHQDKCIQVRHLFESHRRKDDSYSHLFSVLNFFTFNTLGRSNSENFYFEIPSETTRNFGTFEFAVPQIPENGAEFNLAIGLNRIIIKTTILYGPYKNFEQFLSDFGPVIDSQRKHCCLSRLSTKPSGQ